jgi:hypothetical protein
MKNLSIVDQRDKSRQVIDDLADEDSPRGKVARGAVPTPQTKAKREERNAIAEYLARGGNVTVVPPRKAAGFAKTYMRASNTHVISAKN